MAASSKRKKTDSNVDTSTSITNGEEVPRKRRRFAKSKPMEVDQVHSEDLMRKLPAELRNKVYELVLLEEGSIDVRWPYEGRSSTHCRCGNWYCDKTDCPKRIRRSQEPGILLASKWIRREAAAIYYEHTDIVIHLHTSDIDKACQWLRAVEQRCGLSCEERPQPAFNFTSGTWDNINTWLSLAKYVQDTRFPFVDKDFAPLQKRRKSWFHQYFHEYNEQSPFGGGNLQHLRGALDEVVALGMKARKEGWPEQWLEVDFEDWVKEKIQDVRIMRCIKRVEYRRNQRVEKKKEKEKQAVMNKS